jgi:hypothetical protein
LDKITQKQKSLVLSVCSRKKNITEITTSVTGCIKQVNENSDSNCETGKGIKENT